MVNASAPLHAATVRCRQIAESDLDAIADLLARGFPGRRRSFWTEGLARVAASPPAAGLPRFGFLLEHASAPVGVILTLCRESRDANDAPYMRCNLSSWYVEPAFRGYASLLVARATRERNVTYMNISPARKTWPTVEAQGFRQFAEGHYFVCPALSRQGRSAKVLPFTTPEKMAFALTERERVILSAHQELGRLSVVCRAPGGDMPFVFMPFTIRAGRVRLPVVRLIYCRDISDLAMCAGALGRFLLRRGVISIVTDLVGGQPHVIGYYARWWGRKYFKGPATPRVGDLAYSELVFFGP